MIFFILYISYLIISFTYKEYKINSSIEYMKKLIIKANKDIKEKRSTIEYQTSKAYRNKILKEQQSLKNIWEKVIYFTSEEKYKKYTRPINEVVSNTKKIGKEKIDTREMSIYEKWMYFLFGKEQ